MDAETAQFDDGARRLLEMRDGFLRKGKQTAAEARTKADAMALHANRHQRRKIAKVRRRIDEFESWFSAKINEEFARLTAGIDFDARTFSAVQDQAASKLAEIFS